MGNWIKHDFLKQEQDESKYNTQQNIIITVFTLFQSHLNIRTYLTHQHFKGERKDQLLDIALDFLSLSKQGTHSKAKAANFFNTNRLLETVNITEIEINRHNKLDSIAISVHEWNNLRIATHN